jgi:hypothetical protein
MKKENNFETKGMNVRRQIEARTEADSKEGANVSDQINQRASEEETKNE